MALGLVGASKLGTVVPPKDSVPSNALLTEGGVAITTEDGTVLTTEE